MSIETDEERPAAESDGDAQTPAEAELRAQISLLESENERLRREYVRARQSAERRTALGLAALGTFSLFGAVVFPAVRTVLLALGGVGLFGAVLTYYLSPERFIAAETAERVYDAFAANEDALIDELGLSEQRVYVPIDVAGETPARLYVPQYDADVDADRIPDQSALRSLFVITDDGRQHGVSLEPTGGPLFREFDETLVEALAEHPTDLAAQLADALREGFELVETTRLDVNPRDGRASVQVTDAAYSSVAAVDNPIVSFLAVGLAVGLDAPVRVESADREAGAFSVTFRWDPSVVKNEGDPENETDQQPE